MSDTFEETQRGGHGIVLAVDEFGGIAGLATLEQLLGVIVGTVDEEGVNPDRPLVAVDQDTFLIDAGVGIAEINDQLALNLPEGEYRTTTRGGISDGSRVHIGPAGPHTPGWRRCGISRLAADRQGNGPSQN